MQIKGTELFVKALNHEGVDTLFAYPGSYDMDILDTLYQQNDIEVILPRHEQGLIHAADGYARSTGKTGVCLVTSGPGATNLVTGIATANYDSVPLVCFTGQVSTNLIGNDAFQEVDIIGITRPICKYGITVRHREDLGRIIKEAFYIAASGRPGPVVIDLPKDMMIAMGDDAYPETASIRGYKPNAGVHNGQLNKVVKMLKAAKKPLFLIGGGVHTAAAGTSLTKLVNQTKVPVVTTIMGKGAIDTANPLYIGNLGMHGIYAANMAVNHCDLLISIGTRFNDRITGRLDTFATHAKIIHIDIDPASISKNIKVDVPIVSDAKTAIDALLEMTDCCEQQEWIHEIYDHLAADHNAAAKESSLPQKIIQQINTLFKDVIVVTDVGQHQMWAAAHLHLSNRKKLLTSGGLGTMGYGLPAAIGASLGNPDKQIICISGDGGMQMNIQELATATAYELPIIICIFNNSYLGMVRQWQQLFYDKRYACTCLRKKKSCQEQCQGPGLQCPEYSPDFIKLAESYGAYGIRVHHPNDINAAFLKAMNNKDAPTVIEFIIDSEELVLPMVRGGQSLENMILDY